MKLSRVEVLVVVIALMLAGCATDKKSEASLPSDGKVEGTLTINGQTYPLKYVYVGKEPRPSEGEPPGIEVLVTNAALSYELLSKIFLELEVDPFRRKESQVLKPDMRLRTTNSTSPSPVTLAKAFPTGLTYRCQ